MKDFPAQKVAAPQLQKQKKAQKEPASADVTAKKEFRGKQRPNVSVEYLPDGWIPVQSRTRPGQFAYKHAETGTRSIEIPTAGNQQNLIDRYAATRPSAAASNLKSPPSQPKVDEQRAAVELPKGWVATPSQSRPGMVVYKHVGTDCRTEEVPTRENQQAFIERGLEIRQALHNAKKMAQSEDGSRRSMAKRDEESVGWTTIKSTPSRLEKHQPRTIASMLSNWGDEMIRNAAELQAAQKESADNEQFDSVPEGLVDGEEPQSITQWLEGVRPKYGRLTKEFAACGVRNVADLEAINEADFDTLWNRIKERFGDKKPHLTRMLREINAVREHGHSRNEGDANVPSEEVPLGLGGGEQEEAAEEGGGQSKVDGSTLGGAPPEPLQDEEEEEEEDLEEVDLEESRAGSRNIPKEYCCPISFEIMRDPVIAAGVRTTNAPT